MLDARTTPMDTSKSQNTLSNLRRLKSSNDYDQEPLEVAKEKGKTNEYTYLLS